MRRLERRDPGFVITKTPLRISFAGGGTDLPEFYADDYGCVVSTTIAQYIYVTVKRHGHLFNEHYRLNYSETENVREVDAIKNVIARECLRLVPVEPPIYISTVADLPAFSGLGSSSAFAVRRSNTGASGNVLPMRSRIAWARARRSSSSNRVSHTRSLSSAAAGMASTAASATRSERTVSS